MHLKFKNLTLPYGVIQGMLWGSYAPIFGFSSVYLLSRDFTSTQIGLLIAIACLISAILQPVIASYADKTDSLSLKSLILIIAAISLALAVCTLLMPTSMKWLIALLFGGNAAILQILVPLVNALGMESINQGQKMNFGFSRGMGSLGYAVMAYILGIVVAKCGTVSVVASIIILYVIFLLAVLIYPFTKPSISERPSADAKTKPDKDSFLAFIKRYPKFAVFLIGCTLAYVSHNLINNFLYQITILKGGGSEEMGIIMSFASAIELPTMFLFGYMVKKIRCDIWIRVAGIAFMLKTLGTLLVPNVYGMYAVQLLQMLGWALMIVSSIYYVNMLMNERDRIKGQAYMTMTCTMGSVIGAAAGGVLIDNLGTAAMLVFATACAAVGMIIMLFAAEQTNA